MSVANKAAEADSNNRVEIKRTLTFWSGCSLLLGSIIGAGIFISPKGVLLGSGSVGLCLIIWAICGIQSILVSLAYAELGTVVPEFGGTYIYFLEGFSPNRREKKVWWRGLAAFLYVWQSCFLGEGLGTAVLALTAAEYFVRLGAGGCPDWASYSSPKTAVSLIATLITMLITFINAYSVRLAVSIQNTFSGAKLAGVALIIIGGIYRLANGHTEVLETGFEGTSFTYGNLATAFYSGIWSYGGWTGLNFVAKEMKNLNRDLPLAIIVSTTTVLICYILVNVAYFSALTKQELLASETVAVGFGGKVAGITGEVAMILLVASSVFGALNGACFVSGRVSYVAATEGHMIKVLSYIHKDRYTPAASICFNGLLAVTLIGASDISGLISLGIFLSKFFGIFVMIALLIFRKTRKDAPRPIKVPLFIPIVEIIFSVFLIVTPFLEPPRVEYLYGIGYHIVGVLVYFIFVHHGYTIPGIGKFTKIVQILLDVVPEEYCDGETKAKK